MDYVYIIWCQDGKNTPLQFGYCCIDYRTAREAVRLQVEGGKLIESPGFDDRYYTVQVPGSWPVKHRVSCYGERADGMLYFAVKHKVNKD